MKKLFLFVLMIIMPFGAIAETSGKGGDDFRSTAKEYQLKAADAVSSGHPENAAIYTRLSEIKEEAAKLADEGKWSEIDWSEYHELNGKLTNHPKKLKK